MTTSGAYAREDWSPLGKEVRRWETRTSAHPTMPSTSGSGRPISEVRLDEDFASEAGYSRPQFLRKPPMGEERDPPVIKEHHVCGVVDEWGENAGRWGKGSKAFEPPRKKVKDGE